MLENEKWETSHYFREMFRETTEFPEDDRYTPWYSDIRLISQITPYLLLGNARAANPDILLEHGIRNVLTFSKYPAPSPRIYQNLDIAHYTFLLGDSNTPNPEPKEKLIRLIFPWLERAEKKGQAILIHCLGGVSRSPAFTITLLMRSKGMTFPQARDRVVTCHPPTAPNPSVMQFFLECIEHALPEDYHDWYLKRLEEILRAAKFLKKS